MDRLGNHQALIAVDPKRLYEVWDIVKPGIEKVREYSEGWISEDVYHSIKSGFSTLFIVNRDGDYLGFVVCYESSDWKGKTLHLWLVYNDSDTDIIDHHFEDFKAMAKTTGAYAITFESPRNWERRLKVYGFKPVHTLYALEV